MSLPVYTQKSKEKLKLSSKPFASGGEGNLYKIIAPKQRSHSVVKIYHPNKLTPTKEEKINYLLQHPPQNTEAQSLVWVQDIVLDANGNFLGFIMPFVKGEKLEILCTPNLPKKLANTWYRFHHEAEDALDLRLKICYNLAAAIHQIHACNRYILVDLKPDNVIITREGLVSLVDLDSVEVVENGYKLFDAPVATPEYTPAEYYKKDNEYDPTQQQSWDRFSMAVIFYKLLLGIHPFAGSFKVPYENAATLAQKIEQGLFVHSPTISQYRRSIPPPHKGFFDLGNELQQLFYDCFVEGSIQPELRPTAHAWCSAIMQHLDIHRFRALPSKTINMPIVHAYLDLADQKGIPPTDFLRTLKSKLHPQKESIIPAKPASYNVDVLESLRRINFAILVLGLTYGISSIFFNNNVSIAYLIIFICFLISSAILFFSFIDRQNNLKTYRQKIPLVYRRNLFQKQQKAFQEVQQQAEFFWKQLNQKYRTLFPNIINNQQGNFQQIIDRKLDDLKKELKIQDKAANALIQSEYFEYTSLKEKYNRSLHLSPSFSEALSLDAELSAIDFAIQQSMEGLQKTLGKELKHTQAKYDLLFDEIQRPLTKIERSVKQKIGKYKKHLAQAKKQEEQKILTAFRRQTKKDLAIVSTNIDLKLTLFKTEIAAFLAQHNITNINQIRDIQAPGFVFLNQGKKISIAPLRYYQIHELLEWWMVVKNGTIELPISIKTEISTRYQEELQTYKKELNAKLAVHQEAANKEKQLVQKEALIILKALREKNQPQIIALQNKYATQKTFLMDLFEKRAIEEKEIHKRYQDKFDRLLEETQKKADLVNTAIQKTYQLGSFTKQQLEAYQQDLQKYNLGLKRFKEEYDQLKEDEQRYKKSQQEVKQYNELDLLHHLLQMFFLKSFS